MIEFVSRAGVATITLDRPPVNALDEAMVEALSAAVTTIETSSEVKVVVVRSARNVFCAGADIVMLASFLDEADGARRLTQYAARLQSVLARLAALPVAVIAEVNGAATGGGLELALACDVRFASTTARLGLTEANIGLVPGGGGTQRLTAVAGRSRALLCLLSGELVPAADARAMGVVDELVDPANLSDRVDSLAHAIAGRTREVVVELKRCVANAGTSHGFHTELEATERLASLDGTQALMRKFLDRGRARAST